MSEIEWRRLAFLWLDTVEWKQDFGEVELYWKFSHEQHKYSITNRPVQDSKLNRFIEREFFINCKTRFSKLNKKHQAEYTQEVLSLIKKENLISPYRYVAYWMQAVVSFQKQQYDDADRWIKLAVNTCMQVHEHWDLGEIYALATSLAARQNEIDQSYRFLNIAIENCNVFKTADILYRNMPEGYAVRLPEKGDAYEAYQLPACESLIHYYNSSQNRSGTSQNKELIERDYFRRCHELYKRLPLSEQFNFISHVDSLITRYSMTSPYKVMFDLCVASYNDSIWNLDISCKGYQHVLESSSALPYPALVYTDSLAFRNARFRQHRIEHLQGHTTKFRKVEELDSIRKAAHEKISNRLWLEEYSDYALGYFEAAAALHRQKNYTAADSLLGIYFKLCEHPDNEMVNIGFPPAMEPIEPALNLNASIGYHLSEQQLINRLERYRQYQASNVVKYILALPERERDYAWNRMVGQLNQLHNASLQRYQSHGIAEAAYNNALHTRTLALTSSRLLARVDTLPISQQRDSLLQLNTSKWQDVACQLDSTEAAIEIVMAHPIDDSSGEVTYYAIILSGRNPYPQVVELCKASALDSLLQGAQLGNANSIDQLYTWKQQGAQLYHLCISPILPYLQGIQSFSIAKTGHINLLNLNAIPCSANQRMMDRYQITNVSTTAHPLPHKQSRGLSTLISACIYGGLDYYPQSLRAASNTYRDDRDGLLYLSNTSNEADTISQLLNEHDCLTYTYKGADGTEESVKGLDGHSPDILHFATHSFYINEDSLRRQRLSPSIESLSRKLQPLRYTGLHLANSALAWYGHDTHNDTEDGLLTAEEISHLDLSQTKLVVLSACSSGLGQIDEVDGVIGLQHAFKRAGVQTLVMSLWPVPDETTKLLMEYFYTNLMTGENYHQALVHAMQTLRQNPHYEKPHYWAGFVVLD